MSVFFPGVVKRLVNPNGEVVSEVDTSGNLTLLGGVTAGGNVVVTGSVAVTTTVTQALTAAGAVDTTSPVTTLVGPTSSTYAITLAAPSRAGMLKVITMLSTTAADAVTMVLTNVVGGTQATSASFDAAGETLVLVSNATKWIVIKEQGVTLS